MGREAMERGSATNSQPETVAAALQRTLSAGKKALEYVMVDAFTSAAFKGNPAAVVLLPNERDEQWMQNVAAEFNVSQTAFVVRKNPDSLSRVNEENGHSERASFNHEFHIRWFTPTREVPMCGHATLASAYVLFKSGLVDSDNITFHSLSGKLIARKDKKSPLTKTGETPESSIELDFPMTEITACDKAEIKALSKTLNGVEVSSVWRSGADDLVVELSSAEEVEKLEPQMHELEQCRGRGLHVTGKASEESGVDFMTRCFFPKFKLNEDPVCGSAHCAITPFWAKKLGKDSLEAYQASKRGGYLSLRVSWEDKRVYMRGSAVITMTGVLLV